MLLTLWRSLAFSVYKRDLGLHVLAMKAESDVLAENVLAKLPLASALPMTFGSHLAVALLCVQTTLLRKLKKIGREEQCIGVG